LSNDDSTGALFSVAPPSIPSCPDDGQTNPERSTQRFLGQVSARTRNGDELPAKGDRRHGLQSGTILVREWDGKSPACHGPGPGLSWNGTTYRSLTQIAFAMTGTRWSGPRFFGLRSRPEKLASSP
jgi:hypothetical protein